MKCSQTNQEGTDKIILMFGHTLGKRSKSSIYYTGEMTPACSTVGKCLRQANEIGQTKMFDNHQLTEGLVYRPCPNWLSSQIMCCLPKTIPQVHLGTNSPPLSFPVCAVNQFLHTIQTYKLALWVLKKKKKSPRRHLQLRQAYLKINGQPYIGIYRTTAFTSFKFYQTTFDKLLQDAIIEFLFTSTSVEKDIKKYIYIYS